MCSTKYFGDDFHLNQVSCQHLFRTGGGMHPPTWHLVMPPLHPPVFAPGPELRVENRSANISAGCGQRRRINFIFAIAIIGTTWFHLQEFSRI